MNKRKYILFCAVLLLLVATNIFSDKYDRSYKIEELTIMNGTRTSSSSETFYGYGSNEYDAVSTPEASLPSGDYKVTIKYKANNDGNYVRIVGRSKNKDIEITEDLSSSKKMKTINLSFDEDVSSFKVYVHFSGNGELLFRKIIVESAQISVTDTIVWLTILTGILSVFGILSFYKPNEEKRKNALVFLCLLGIAIFASYPMYNDHILFGHDIHFHLTRIEGIKNALLSGQFPVRLHSSTEYDYGYAAPIFYPEIFLYFPALLRIMGVSLTGTVQIFIACINFITAAIMYVSVYKITKIRTIGIISSIIYVLSSYHLCDTYYRFALGETLAMAFIPLLVYGIYELVYNDYTKWPYVVLATSCIMQSHVLSTLIAAGFVFLVVILNFKKVLEIKRLTSCIKAVILVILINLWFIIPFISMMGENTKISDMATNVANYTINVMQLFQINKGIQIGLPILISITVCIYCLVLRKIEDKKQENFVTVLLGLGLLSLFASTNLFPWKSIVNISILEEKVSMIQFPWRLLAFASVFLSIAAGYGFFYFVKSAEIQRTMVILIFTCSVIYASLYLENNYLINGAFCYKGAIVENNGISTAEYYYKGTSKVDYLERGETVEGSSEQIIISKFERLKGKISVDIENLSKEEQFIEVPLAYYPLYSAKINDEINLKIEKGNKNVLRIVIPPQLKGNVLVQYSEPKLWILTDFISLFTFVIFLYSINRKQKNIINKVGILLFKKRNKTIHS